MADLTAVYAALQKADAAGDTAGAKQLADYIRTQSPSTPAAPPVNPATADYGSTLQFGPFDTHIPISGGVQNFLAGAGKAPMDLLRGTGQLLGLESRKDVADSRAVDAPLMATGAGKVGNLTGNVATMLPTAFIPWANTLAGAGAIGAVSGLLQPSTGTGETATNVGLGGALGPAGILAGRAVGAVGQGAKAALWDPFTKVGQNRIAARTMQAFAGNPSDAAAAAANLSKPPSMLPGVQPTTAELANNAGMSQLERTLQNNPEFMTALTNRNQANRAAMTGALGGIAGTDADMAAAHAARTQAASGLYDAAGKASAPLDNEMTALLQRPSMQTAITRAQSLAAENGDSFGLAPTMKYLPTQLSGKDLQYLKMSLNDLANSGPQMGMGAHEVGAVKGTLGSLNSWITKNVPELKAADAAFADLSKPINQMQIGQQLSNKLIPALGDFNPDLARTNASAYASAVRNGDQLAANATGWKGSTLANVLSPQQMQTVNQVGEQLARRAQATDLGRATGSNTGQNIVSQNVLSQFLGPLGLPQGVASRFASGAVGRSLGQLPTKLLYGAVEPDVMTHLANAALDPQMAAGLLMMKQNPAIARALWARQGLLSAPTVGLGQALAYPSK
jgi:hypothetical protein